MKFKKALLLMGLSCFLAAGTAAAVEASVKEDDPNVRKVEASVKEFRDANGETPLVHVYTPEEITEWVILGTDIYNLKDVNACQFSDDIVLRARKHVAAAYDYLYSHMLLTGSCVPRDTAMGIFYLEKAADLAYPAALRKLGFFYETGRYVAQDTVKAEALMREAAEMGYVPARIDWAGMLLRDLGSAQDMPEAWVLLKKSVKSTPWEEEYITLYIQELESRIPENVLAEAARKSFY
ncbi:MAG: sel1 repeat family protein [Succinimonas sp.]|nr:sel1 repeat family protein [Succinimonas sp.]